MLSIIIITKNEQANIADCIKSVSFADEVIVLDSGSTDQTTSIARDLGAKVYHTTHWPGFGPQKNKALSLATKAWVLSIDADERVSPRLATQIQEVLKNPIADAYSVTRLSCFGGRWIRHSGWWPDRIVRLFNKDKAQFKNVAVHESLVVNGSTKELDAHLIHYPYDSFERLISKVNQYSTAAAEQLYAKNKKISVLGIGTKALWTFIRLYVIRKGFLDGKHGFILAGVAAFGSFLRYSKLWFLNKKTNWRPLPPDR